MVDMWYIFHFRGLILRAPSTSSYMVNEPSTSKTAHLKTRNETTNASAHIFQEFIRHAYRMTATRGSIFKLLRYFKLHFLWTFDRIPTKPWTRNSMTFALLSMTKLAIFTVKILSNFFTRNS